MNLRAFLYEHRLRGCDLVRAAASKGFHLTAPDVSNTLSGRKYYFPPSARVRLSLMAALKKLGFSRADIEAIDGIKEI